MNMISDETAMNQTIRIELIRHGETEWNTLKKYQGITDVPLSAAGRRKLKKSDSCPQHVYVSPLLRARETAAILFPEARQIVVEGLQEMNFGAFEGKSYREMEKDADYRAWVDGMCLGRCPGGESRQEYCDRVCRAFLQVLRDEMDRLSRGSWHGLCPENLGDRMTEDTAGDAENTESAEMENAANTASAEMENAVNTESAGDAENAVNTAGAEIVIVAHGGTQMAVLERFAAERRDYYQWQLPAGHGYLLEVDPGEIPCLISGERSTEPPRLPLLYVVGTCDHTAQAPGAGSTAG